MADGLTSALGEAVARAALPARLELAGGIGRYRAELEGAVCFCCLEALQNAAKHAGEGARATVSLAEEEGMLRLEVDDDGCGHDPRVNGSGTGVLGMADRLGALGGTLQVDSAPGAGTRVRGRVPLDRA